MRGWLAAMLIALVGMGGGAAGMVAGCATRDDGSPGDGRRVTKLPQPGPELSQELMIALAMARNYHHKAEIYLKEARIEQATTAVRQVLSIQFPTGSSEGEDIELDARARLAKLLVPQGKLDEAMAVVNEGIARAHRHSFFLANLHSVRGEVLEARAAKLAERDKGQAAAARREAIESYDQAIQIEKALIEQLSGGEEAE
ncbi:MAG TPA: hypothetical protein VEL05_01025 [Candidatus Acidoferrum sp.]|nr:hypothetical protein [Candidatus Acidoferrum sp.]